MSRRPSAGLFGSFAPVAVQQLAVIARSRSVRLVALFALCLTPPARAFDSGPVMRIEEDWEIVVGEPSPDENLPQLYVVSTPSGSIDGQYSVFEINNLLLPDFYGGGLQFQTWWGDQATGEAHHTNYSSLSTNGETITFTVRLRAWGDGNVSFKVQNGQSTTWGAFGNNSSLRLVRDCGLSTLSSYTPESSAKYSRVGSGRGRIQTFRIKQVRYYDANGNLLSTDDTDRDAQIDEPS
jgi:hypothetical protein